MFFHIKNYLCPIQRWLVTQVCRFSNCKLAVQSKLGPQRLDKLRYSNVHRICVHAVFLFNRGLMYNVHKLYYILYNESSYSVYFELKVHTTYCVYCVGKYYIKCVLMCMYIYYIQCVLCTLYCLQCSVYCVLCSVYCVKEYAYYMYCVLCTV